MGNVAINSLSLVAYCLSDETKKFVKNIKIIYGHMNNNSSKLSKEQAEALKNISRHFYHTTTIDTGIDTGIDPTILKRWMKVAVIFDQLPSGHTLYKKIDDFNALKGPINMYKRLAEEFIVKSTSTQVKSAKSRIKKVLDGATLLLGHVDKTPSFFYNGRLFILQLTSNGLVYQSQRDYNNGEISGIYVGRKQNKFTGQVIVQDNLSETLILAFLKVLERVVTRLSPKEKGI